MNEIEKTAYNGVWWRGVFDFLKNSLNSLGHGNVAQLVSRDLTCARKTSLHHHHQPVPLTPGRMRPWTNAAHAKSWLCHQHDVIGTRIIGPSHVFPASVVQCWWSRTHWRQFFLFLDDRSRTRGGRDKDRRVVRSERPFCAPLLYCAVICLFLAHLLACTILAVFLRPLINKLFSPTGLLLTGCFVCHTILGKPQTLLCVWKAQEAGRFWDTGNAEIGTDDHTTLKVA